TSDGMVYNVDSMVPNFDPADLAAASSVVPNEIRDQYLNLPADFSQATSTLAATVTSGAASRYEQALRLQSFFRTQFEYSTEVQAGHGGDRLEQFLFETQTGYCEQFAGAF